ncbi:MAG TPA: hypothetical protein VLI71_14165 [Gammaproteobacteria bacterium]|nr:hypothetical protein [Gammaproteobacteria bacterium]
MRATRDSAQRRVYGDSWLTTVVKALSGAAVYGMLWAVTAFSAALVAASG